MHFKELTVHPLHPAPWRALFKGITFSCCSFLVTFWLWLFICPAPYLWSSRIESPLFSRLTSFMVLQLQLPSIRYKPPKWHVLKKLPRWTHLFNFIVFPAHQISMANLMCPNSILNLYSNYHLPLLVTPVLHFLSFLQQANQRMPWQPCPHPEPSTFHLSQCCLTDGSPNPAALDHFTDLRTRLPIPRLAPLVSVLSKVSGSLDCNIGHATSVLQHHPHTTFHLKAFKMVSRCTWSDSYSTLLLPLALPATHCIPACQPLCCSANVTGSYPSQGLCNTVLAMWDVEKPRKKTTNSFPYQLHSDAIFSVWSHWQLPLQVKTPLPFLHLIFPIAFITTWDTPYVCYLFQTYFLKIESPWMWGLCYIPSIYNSSGTW